MSKKTYKSGQKTPKTGKVKEVNTKGKVVETDIDVKKGNPLPPTDKKGHGYQY